MPAEREHGAIRQHVMVRPVCRPVNPALHDDGDLGGRGTGLAPLSATDETLLAVMIPSKGHVERGGSSVEE